MGAQKSKTNCRTPLYFDEITVRQLTARFEEFSDGRSYIAESHFKTILSNIDPTLVDLTFKSLVSISQMQKIKLQNFLHIADLVFGTYDQQAEFINMLGAPLNNIIEFIAKSFLLLEGAKYSKMELNKLLGHIQKNAPLNTSPQNNLSKWLSSSIVFILLFKTVFNYILLKKHMSKMPSITCQTILSNPSILIIKAHLPPSFRQEWRLLFSSVKDGESFSKLLNAVNGKGACIVVVESSRGSIFGGFLNEGFKCGPKYLGDERCFLFKDEDVVYIYRATGYNRNIAYLNSQQVTLPNGLGIGNSNDKWSLFLSNEFGRGSSCANISIFEPCWLAEENDFNVVQVEVWSVEERSDGSNLHEEVENLNYKEKSILVKDICARAILDLAGKEQHAVDLASDHLQG